jgi:hypothetical protein
MAEPSLAARQSLLEAGVTVFSAAEIRVVSLRAQCRAHKLPTVPISCLPFQAAHRSTLLSLSTVLIYRCSGHRANWGDWGGRVGAVCQPDYALQASGASQRPIILQGTAKEPLQVLSLEDGRHALPLLAGRLPPVSTSPKETLP